MDAILSLSLNDLTVKLQEGSITPESSLYSYMWKALEVHKQVNCLTGFLPECEAQLQELKKRKEKGPLYGIPVSIKEVYGYKGHGASYALAKYLGFTAREDSVIVQVLKKQGAIPFVKTNVPQSGMSYECSNLIYGQTLNPLNLKKTPGGSTGGEAALIAGGGSILGFGTDTAGSIRLPSTFCGLCGLKPTGYRISHRGVFNSFESVLSVTSAIGPMARDVDSLVLCMRSLLCEDMSLLDPYLPPIPFNEKVYSSTSRLRIGYYDTDGYVMPVPCMRRAVLETKRLLEEAGHELISFTPPRIDYMANDLFITGLCADGERLLLKALEGDLIDPNLKPQISVYKIPYWVKKILSFILRPFCPRIARELNSLCGLRSPGELWYSYVAVERYQQKFVTLWKNKKLDVLLCPAMSPAVNVGFLGKLFAASTNSTLFNMLNFPAGVLPVSTVTDDDEEQLKHYEGHYNDHWDKLLKKAATGGVGLPVAVQCVALPWQEEMCLRFMKEVEQLTKEKKQRN